MKEKLLVVACAVSILASAAAVAASRAHAADPAATAENSPLKVIGEDSGTRVYSFRSEGQLCFIASTRGGSGLSLQCPR